MTTDRKPRIAITPDSLKALKVWAALEDIDPGELAAKLILTHAPKRVQDVLGTSTPQPSKNVKRKRLADNPEALQQIKDIWTSGEHNQAEISRRINYHRATVNDAIQRMKEKGELAD
jgi:hypothetical protein